MERTRLVLVQVSELMVSLFIYDLSYLANGTALNDVTDVKNNEFVYVY